MFSRAELIESHVPAIVLDCGTFQSRIGFSHDSHPKAVEPTVVASRKPPLTSSSNDTRFIGTEAIMKSRRTHFRKMPMECGIVTNWDNMELVWRHLLNHKTLGGAKPEDHPMVYVEEPVQPIANREKVAQIMFETFEVPALFLQKSPEACLSTAGNRKTGLVVDAGGGTFTPAPIVDGYVLHRKISKTLGSGRDLTFHLLTLLHKDGRLDYNTPDSTELANQIKEQLCYVADDISQEEKTFSCQQERQFTLPDGSSITVGKERYLCPEAIFQPNLSGNEMPGLHEIVYRCIMSCDKELHDQLFANIVLCGGSALFPGFASRMESELKTLAGPSRKVQVIPSTELHCAYKGATLLSRREEYYHRFVTKEFYDEYGPSAVHRHCI